MLSNGKKRNIKISMYIPHNKSFYTIFNQNEIKKLLSINKRLQQMKAVTIIII